jgi:hypothetical protein
MVVRAGSRGIWRPGGVTKIELLACATYRPAGRGTEASERCCSVSPDRPTGRSRPRIQVLLARNKNRTTLAVGDWNSGLYGRARYG